MKAAFARSRRRENQKRPWDNDVTNDIEKMNGSDGDKIGTKENYGQHFQRLGLLFIIDTS